MKYISSVLLVICFNVEQVIAFDIDIVSCTTSDGRKGVCRPKEHCFYNKMERNRKCPINYVCCPHSGISYKMCLKYAESVFEQPDTGIILPFRRKSKKTSRCGITAVPLIIGGEKANKMEFPHMALIGFGYRRMRAVWLCGGSLISPNYVLTAAHCMDSGRSGPAKWVRLGLLNLKDTSDVVQEITVNKRIYHPGYRNRLNDIALLKLQNDVTFTPFVRPICLDHEGVLKSRSSIATGWGRTSFDSNQQSDYLMKVSLNIIDKPRCSKAYKPNWSFPGLQNSMMCAGVLTGGKDTCQGDSGGPLQVVLKKPYCMYRIIGVTSYGKFCGFSNSPAIYTRVFSYIPWIESVVWGTNHSGF